MSDDPRLQQMIAEATRSGRNIALDAAIATAKMFCEPSPDGHVHTPACVVRALEDLKAMVNEVLPPPSQAN